MAFVTPLPVLARHKLVSVTRYAVLPTTSTNRCARIHMIQVLSTGSPLPAFSLPTNGGNTLSEADISTGPTILYFYPRDATPGCTTEAQDFRDMHKELRESGIAVVGVSKDSVESHDKFVEDLSLPFPLISDDGTLCEAFGVWKLRKRGDKEFMGIERSTFIIKDGKIAKEWRGMKATGHASEVAEAVKAL